MTTRPKILVIDDSPASFVVFEAIFATLPYEIHGAASGAEALKMVEKNDYSLFLINVQMPIMDGFETAYRLRRQKNYLNTPIFFITAFDRDQVYARAPQHVLTEEFIYKPFHPESLRTRIESVLAL